MRRALTAAVAGVGLTAVVGIGVAAAAGSDGPAGRFADALAGLVSNGTITQDQADAVSKALTDAQQQAKEDRQQEWSDRRAELDALLQKTLGMTADEVRSALADGKTLKEIAGDKADELADAAVALVKERAAAGVADGKLTQDQADKLVSRAREQADAWLSGDETSLGRGLGMLFGMGGRGHMMGPGGTGHHGGRDWDGDSDAPSSDASSSASTTTLRI